MISFKKYIINERTLKKVDINKYLQRLQAFIKKLEQGDPFTLAGGAGEEVIQPDPDWLNDIKSKGSLDTPFILARGGNKMSLDKLEKTKEFGGLGFHRERKEVAQTDSLHNQIVELGGGNPISIKVGPNIYNNCVGARKTIGNYPKSDISIIDSQGKEIIFISHKDNAKNGAPSPKGFQRWSGITDYNTPEYPEVGAFVAAVKKILDERGSKTEKGEYLMITGTLKRKIENEVLKYKACFGKNYGAQLFGVNNVNCIIQGAVSLTQGQDGVYTLEGDKMWLSGDVPSGEYNPVLTVYKSGGPGRYDQQVRNAIFCIYPEQGRGGTYI